MARFHFQGLEDYGKTIAKVGDLYGPMCEAMLNRAVQIVVEKLKSASNVFAKHVKAKKARHNKFGWFAQVHFGGKVHNRSETGSGTSAARAATVYEYGRSETTYYTDKNGVRRSIPPQPARPFIRPTVEAVEGEVIAAMEEEMDRILAEKMKEYMK